MDFTESFRKIPMQSRKPSVVDHCVTRFCLQPVVCRYSTFQYPDQDPCPGDFNTDAIFYVSVSVNVPSYFCLTFNSQQNIIFIYRVIMQHFTQNVVISKLS